ncbi:Presenilins-associated rhomboid-like protein, mitochondrial [Halotydeus destructor]|nr:Presenilins-associated rhomboid-like protein, mitochondrial [Halotydeus destructor]
MSFSRLAFRYQNPLTASRNLLVKRSSKTGQTSGPSKTRSPNSHLMKIGSLRKPFVYSCAFPGTAFAVSSVVEHEKLKQQVLQKLAEWQNSVTQAPKAPNVQQISGAILGVVAFACLLYPGIQVSILFLPFISMKAATALKVLMAVDLAGVLLRWRPIDHAGHLGGALAGVSRLRSTQRVGLTLAEDTLSYQTLSVSLDIAVDTMMQSCPLLSHSGIMSFSRFAGPTIGSPNANLMDIQCLWKPFLYLCAFTGTAFTVSSVLEYEKIKRKASSVRQKLTEFLDNFTHEPKAPSGNFQQISGAINGVAAFTCLLYPDSQLGGLCLPFISLRAATSLKVFMAVDAAGVLLRWRPIDHAGHLGGTLAGV